MLWVGWRQQRTETLIAAALLALLVARARADRPRHAVGAYDHDGLATCVAHPATGGVR